MNEHYFGLGATVHCRDGACGKLQKLAVDPASRRISHLIVEEGFLLKRARAFPFALVESTSADAIYLDCHTADLNHIPEYQEKQIDLPAGAQEVEPAVQDLSMATVPSLREAPRVVYEGIPDASEVLSRHTQIYTSDGAFGRLDTVVAHADNGEITYLLVNRGTLLPESFEIPISVTNSLSSDEIYLAITTDEVLERYELGGSVEIDAIPAGELDDTQPQPLAWGGVLPSDADDRVWRDEEQYEDNVVTSQPGQALSSDTVLLAELDQALLEDARTGREVIEVINERGRVTLTGRVHSHAAREAAEEIVRHHPGVQTVVNELRVSS